MPHANPLPEPLRRRLSAVVRRIGERRALDGLGVSRSTLARTLGGLGIYAASQIAIEARLDALDGHTAPPAGDRS